MIEKKFTNGRSFRGVIIPTAGLDEFMGDLSINPQQTQKPSKLSGVPVEPSLYHQAWLLTPSYRLIPVESGYLPPPSAIPVMVRVYHEERPEGNEQAQGEVFAALKKAGELDEAYGKEGSQGPVHSQPTDFPDNHWPEEWAFPDGAGGQSSVRLVLPTMPRHINDLVQLTQ